MSKDKKSDFAEQQQEENVFRPTPAFNFALSTEKDGINPGEATEILFINKGEIKLPDTFSLNPTSNIDKNNSYDIDKTSTWLMINPKESGQIVSKKELEEQSSRFFAEKNRDAGFYPSNNSNQPSDDDIEGYSLNNVMILRTAEQRQKDLTIHQMGGFSKAATQITTNETTVQKEEESGQEAEQGGAWGSKVASQKAEKSCRIM